MIRNTGIICVIVMLCFQLYGQINRYGQPSVFNYPAEITNGSEQNWAITQDHRGVIYVGNDDKGVLEYDGSEWRNIPIPNKSIVRSLACSDNGTVYVGAVSEIGYLAPDVHGKMEYHSLIHHLDSVGRRFFHVWKTYCADDKVYFVSQKNLFIYYPEIDSLRYLENRLNVLFGFYVNGNLYKGEFTEGLIRLMGDTVSVVAKNGEFYRFKNIFGLTSFDDERLLIGINYENEAKSELSIYHMETGEIDSMFGSEEALEYLSNNYLTNLLRLTNGNFAASTAAGGVMIINRQGEMVELVSKDQGMQSQTVYNAFQSPNNYPFSHLWTALGRGVSKLDFTGPLRNFSEESGYQGLTHCINDLNGRIFIGTSNGIFAFRESEGIAGFEKVGADIQRNVWDFEKFKLNNGDEVLLAVGETGLFEIHQDGQVINIEERVAGNIEEEEMNFWGYFLLADPHRKDRIYIGRESSITALENDGRFWTQVFSVDKMGSDIRGLAKVSEDTLWFSSTINGVGYITPLDQTAGKYFLDENAGLPEMVDNNVYNIDGEIVVGASDGIYRRTFSNDQVVFQYDSLLNNYLERGTNKVLKVFKDHSEAIWISYENSELGWIITILDPAAENVYRATTKPFLALERSFSTDAFHCTDTLGVWFTKSNMIFHYSREGQFRDGTYRALLRKVTLDNDSVIYYGAHPQPAGNESFRLCEKQSAQLKPSIKYSDNNIEFRWSAPYYHSPEETEN